MSEASESPAAGGARVGLSCAVLFALALGLRLVGLDYLLPHAPEPDMYLAYQAEAIHAGDGSLEGHPIWGKYPHLLPRLVAATAGGPGEPPGLPVDGPADASFGNLREAHLRHATHWAWWTRLWSAVLSSLGVPLTYLLARRFLGERGGWLAALLLATCLLHLCLSQQARPHGPLGTALLACVIGGLAVVDAARRAEFASFPWKRWAGFSALVFLAVGMLHNGLAAGPLVVAVWWFAGGPKRFKRMGSWLLPAAATALAIGLFYPFLWSETGGGENVAVGEEGVVQAGHEVRLSWFSGGGFADLAKAVSDYDPWLGGLAALGGLLALAQLATGGWTAGERARRDLVLCLSLALPYLLVVGLFERSYPRFATPLLPFAALLGAYALLRVGRRPLVLGTAALLALLPPTVQVARKLQLNLRPDTYELLYGELRREGVLDRPSILIEPSTVPPAIARVTHWKGASASDFRDAQMYRVPWAEYWRGRTAELPSDWLELREAPGRMNVDRRRLNSRDPLVRAQQMADEVARLLRDERARWFVKTAPFRFDAGGILQNASVQAGYETQLFVSPWADSERTPGAQNGYEKERLWRTLWLRERWGAGLELARRPAAGE